MLPVLSQSEADLTACYVQDIAALLDSFSEKDTSSKQSLQQMLSSDQAAFSRASIRVLAHANGSAGSRYVLHLLRKHNLLVEALADPIGSKREDAIAAARVISQIGAPIDADLERVLSATLSLPPVPANAARVLRLLDVLDVASAQPRFYLFQKELMDYPDTNVRGRATLLIACSSKSAALVGRMLLDEDVQVQANAVEALWSFDSAEAHPLLVNAARSKPPRVAGNAAVGLYRMGDLSSFGLMFGMAQQDDPVRRAIAAWAMGETGDPRFLPFLSAWFLRSSGDERVNILQALGRIRRREKLLAEAGAIEIRTWDATMNGSSRHLVLSLWSSSKADLSVMKPTDFAIWEGGSLVQDYEISGHSNPALGIYGFILPRFSTATDPYRIAIMDALQRCLKHKRADDLWRLDRYLTEPRTGESGPVLEKAALPYEESLLGPLAKTHQRGFLASPEALQKIVDSPGIRDRAADDVIAAFDHHSEAMIKFSGKRKLFLFLPSQYVGRLGRQIARLTSFIANERITLHGIAPKGADNCEEFQALCLASEGGSFAALTPEQMPSAVERIYAQSINRFEVTYRVPEQSEPADGSLQITSNNGCGRASFSFTGV
jgi:HEAT repeat protein